MTIAAHAARVLAIAIALLGLLDPSLTSMRPTRADIALIASERVDSALAARLADRLDDDYNIVRGAFANAAATVVVGTALPERIPSGPIYAVSNANEPGISTFAIPAEVPINARIRTRVGWHIGQLPGRAELIADGVVVDTATPSESANSVNLTLAPTAPGPVHLRVCRPERSEGPACADALTNVVDEQHAVLFFDRRPSWMSTFVRRSLEQDRRFAIASRVMTSRAVSTDAGQPPSTLADPALLELYDVIVVGAPTSLTASDVAGLETFLRRRGGSVVLLYDEIPTSGVHERLTGVMRWTPATLRTAAMARAEEDTSSLEVTEAAWPTTLPITADVRARVALGPCHPERSEVSARGQVQVPRCTRDDMPLVWTTGAGAGQVIVSGALDSWKFRDRATSGFDEFWRATISRAAREASRAVALTVTPNIAQPGEQMTIRVAACRPEPLDFARSKLREGPACTKPRVTLDSIALDVWPTNQPGEFTARLRAPAIGDHWIRATAGGAKTEAPIAVRQSVTRVPRFELLTVQMVARASGGLAGSADSVERAIRARVVPEKRMERWWPMRSGWWILPFAALLGFEWLVRRRKGLA